MPHALLKKNTKHEEEKTTLAYVGDVTVKTCVLHACYRTCDVARRAC